jgi:septal ring factor EnvC (AmiA/AmiB activator)
LSTLTKVLIVLMSVFSLFLCGVVVSYVANAENYKKAVDDQRRQASVARNRQQNAEDELAEYKKTADEAKASLEKQISDMTINTDSLQAKITDLQRLNDQLTQNVANSADSVKVSSATQAKLLDQTQATQAANKDLEAQVTRLTTELQETNQTLLDKMAIIETLQAKNNRLVETNQDLEARVNGPLQPYGQVATAPRPVTPLPGLAQPATTQSQPIALNGRIVSVDVPLAEISIGAAAGVKQKMTFNVTRGDQFVCYLQVLDVEPDRAVGVLKMMQTQPRAGDAITTNL